MKYAKLPLTLEQQADLLLTRGMVGDRARMIERLGAVNYYRLSGYWYPFRAPNPADPSKPLDGFKPGTTFDEVWNRYVFDRRLRLLVMDVVERVEIAIRTRLSFYHAHAHGPFAYGCDDTTCLPYLNQKDYGGFIGPILAEAARSKETFVRHFQDTYGDSHRHLPVWMVTEVMTFGTMLTFFRGVHGGIKSQIAAAFGIHDTVLESWLLTLNTVRNICAHHGRLWNREFGVKPLIPAKAKHPHWHVPVVIKNDRVFGVLSILKYSLDRIAPQSHWPVRLIALLDEYPYVPRLSMGFPVDWRKSPIWASVMPPHSGAVKGDGDGI
jgi:abortive infection bacteriophage resistance protein